jgi:hypothetical protein
VTTGRLHAGALFALFQLAGYIEKQLLQFSLTRIDALQFSGVGG